MPQATPAALGHVDLLIIGTSPLASLLAGLLAVQHGKSVLLQGGRTAGQRLSRGIDLSVGAISRPQTWALLAHTVPETITLIRRFGTRAALGRLDPMLVADTAAGRQALGHVGHMAQGYGVAAETVPAKSLPEGTEGLVLRDAVVLRRAALAPALDGWLAQAGVQRLPADAPVNVEADGSATCADGPQTLSARQTILADDDAIGLHLPAASWPTLLHRRPMTTIMTAPTRTLAAPIMLVIDGGAVLQQADSGSVLAQGPGDIAAFAGRLRDALGSPFEQVGQSGYLQLQTRDGAAAVGRVGGTGPDVVAGCGSFGAFIAPAIARWLSGSATAAESAWFGDRLVSRMAQDSPVSDIGAEPALWA